MNREQGRGPVGSAAGPATGVTSGSAEAVADLFRAALAHHGAGAFAEAEQQYRKVLALAPLHLKSLHNLGLLALQRGDAPAAVELIGKAISVNDRVPEFHYNVALAWRALGRIDHVTAHLERAIALKSDYALAHLNLGNARREQGRLAEAVASYERAAALAPDSAAAHFNLANALAEQGRFAAAVEHYRRVIALEPGQAEPYGRLGAALLAQGKPGEAVAAFEEALRRKPDSPGGHVALARAAMAAGQTDRAIEAASRAVEQAETAETKSVFALCVGQARFTAGNERIRRLVLRALVEEWARPRDLTGVCISLVKLNPAVRDGIARAQAAWPARLAGSDLLDAAAMTALASDALLCALLERDPIADIGLERLLTNLRAALLAAALAGAAVDASLLRFYGALARQCFINEYVYALPEAEAAQARKLQAAVAEALADGAAVPPLSVVAVAAYYPLHELPNAAALRRQAWPEPVEAAIVQQIEEPEAERAIAAVLPQLTAIDDEVSQAVRQQYEESPYPRWVRTHAPAAAAPEAAPERMAEVLIAGCGTGLSTIEFALNVRAAHILAVDLSRASLSYAKRMAQKFGLDRIAFAQADITRLGTLGRSFDFIDASGVLHHLADPWQGWRVLLSLLRPGGTMQVGLYSEAGRQNIVAARALIAARGYRPVADDIRRCREEIATADDPLLRSVTRWDDFYALHECRDLLFHVQEHRIALPEIKAFLDANAVQFAGFHLDAAVMRRFAERFPGAAARCDLDCWHAFESEAPDTFAAMYQFQVRKPPAAGG